MKTIRQSLFIQILVVLLILQGCAGLNQREVGEQPTRDPESITFFMELDRIAHQYKAADASTHKISDFPYLRTNRFLEGMEKKIHGPEQEYLWIEWMQKLDLEAREKEIANLPQAALEKLSERTGELADRKTIFERAGVYSNRLLAGDRRHPGFIPKVKEAARVPDEYLTAMRVFGLYPLAAIPVSMATYKAHSKYKRWHQIAPDRFKTTGQLVTFIPAPGAERPAGQEIVRLFDSRARDAFGLPKLTSEDIYEIARLFAPVFTQDVSGDYDRFGRVLWKNHNVTIEFARPAVYYYISHVFIDGAPAIQMNYSIWYSARMGENSPRIERGPLDGVTVRITVDSSGNPVMADAMNSCGCYYFFIPRKEYVKEIIKKPHDFAPLVPTWLPDEFPKEPMNFWINSGWHQIQNIRAGGIPAEPVHYELLPYHLLESLPQENGLKESVFTPEGIMKNSYRIEPYIFFSMGIPKIGYMRQRGHHAIKMVGREHFTNPEIYDRNFVFDYYSASKKQEVLTMGYD